MREVTMEEQAANVDNLSFGDDRLGVMFYTDVVEDRRKTLAEGRKCFREQEFVKIFVPGDRNPVVRKVQVTGNDHTDDRLRFPKQYARFKANQEQRTHEGTPLTLWPQMPAVLAKELEFLNIFTVEQLAQLADTHVAKIQGGQQWKQKAAEFVSALKDQEQVSRLQTQLTERDNRIDSLEKVVQEQAARIDKMLRKLEK